MENASLFFHLLKNMSSFPLLVFKGNLSLLDIFFIFPQKALSKWKFCAAGPSFRKLDEGTSVMGAPATEAERRGRSERVFFGVLFDRIMF